MNDCFLQKMISPKKKIFLYQACFGPMFYLDIASFQNMSQQEKQKIVSFIICYFISLQRKFEFLDICVLNLFNKVQLICRYSDTKPNIYFNIVSIPPFPEIPYLCYFCHSSMDQGVLSAGHLSNQQTVSAHCSFFLFNLKFWKDPFHE